MRRETVAAARHTPKAAHRGIAGWRYSKAVSVRSPSEQQTERGHDQTSALQANPPATAPSGAAQVLALQRTVGNRAVANMLSRDETTTTPESAFEGAVRASDWDVAARALSAIESAERQRRIGALATEPLLRIWQASERLLLEELTTMLAVELRTSAHAAGAAAIQREDDYAAAMRDHDWPHVARALGAFDDAGVLAKLATLDLDGLNELSAAARAGGAPMQRVFEMVEPKRITKLGDEWGAAVRSGNWERAVVLVQAYSDGDLAAKLTALNLDQISAITRKAQTMTSYQRVYRAAEPIRIATLEREYNTAVGAADWPRVATLANGYTDGDLRTKLTAIQTAGNLAALDTAAVAEIPRIGDRVHRFITFMQNGPAAAGNTSEYTVTTPGTEVHHATGVGGGDVRARTDTSFQVGGAGPTRTGGYELEYSGPDAAKTHWLQFISRSIKSEKTGAPDTYLSATVNSSGTRGGGGYPLTTDPSKPSWNTDAATAASPFYDAGGIDIRDPTHETMLDAPSSAAGFAAVAFRAGADKVVSEANFAAYLVRDMEVLYRVNVRVRWVFERAIHWNDTTKTIVSDPPRNNAVTATARVTALASDHRARLASDFPRFDYFP